MKHLTVLALYVFCKTTGYRFSKTHRHEETIFYRSGCVQANQLCEGLTFKQYFSIYK